MRTIRDGTYRGLSEDLGVLVYGRRVDGDAVSLAHQVCRSVTVRELGVFLDVANHEDTARQATRLVDDTVCVTQKGEIFSDEDITVLYMEKAEEEEKKT